MVEGWPGPAITTRYPKNCGGCPREFAKIAPTTTRISEHMYLKVVLDIFLERHGRHQFGEGRRAVRRQAEKREEGMEGDGAALLDGDDAEGDGHDDDADYDDDPDSNDDDSSAGADGSDYVV